MCIYMYLEQSEWTIILFCTYLTHEYVMQLYCNFVETYVALAQMQNACQYSIVNNFPARMSYEAMYGVGMCIFHCK